MPKGSLLQIITIHDDPVLSIISMTKDSFLTGGFDRMLCMINETVDNQVKFLDHFQTKIITSLVKINDDRFASSSLDGTVKIMDLKANGLYASFETKHKSPVNCIDFLSSSNKLFAAEDSGDISEWDVSTKKYSESFKGHTKRVLQVKVVNSEHIASSSNDMSLRVWKITTKTEVIKVECTSAIRTICKYTDQCFAYGDEIGNITVYNIGRKANEGVVSGHKGICHQIISLHQNEHYFCSCGEDKRIVFWNLSSRKKTGEIKDAHFSRVLSIAQLNNGEIVSSGIDNLLKTWKISY